MRRNKLCPSFLIHCPATLTSFTSPHSVFSEQGCSRAQDKSLCTCSGVHSPLPPLLPFEPLLQDKVPILWLAGDKGKYQKGALLVDTQETPQGKGILHMLRHPLQPRATLFSGKAGKGSPIGGRPRRGSRNEGRKGKKRGSSSLESPRNRRPEKYDAATHLGRHFGSTASRGRRPTWKRAER